MQPTRRVRSSSPRGKGGGVKGGEVISGDEPRVVDAGGGSRKERGGGASKEGGDGKKKRKSSENSLDSHENPKKKQTTAEESDWEGFDTQEPVMDQRRPSRSSQPSSVPKGIERDAGMVSSSAPVKPSNVHVAQNSVQNKNVRNSNAMGPPSSNSARIDLDSMESLPDGTKQVLLTSLHETRLITSLNPCKMEICLKELCGDIEKFEYLKSGSIIVTTKSIDQTKKLLKAKALPKYDMPIRVGVAWNRQLTYGKIYAEEFSHDTLDELLGYLKPHGVVGARKLFTDPAKSHVPLYVLTFVGTLPNHVILGSIKYNIDKYIPRPMRCRNCHRLGHTTKKCKSKETCKYCSTTQHSSENCNAVTKKCINCREEHDSYSTHCPKLLVEHKICQLTAERGISFTEAREILSPRSSNYQPSQISIPLSSQRDFPNLTQTQSQAKSQYSSSIIGPSQRSRRNDPIFNPVGNKSIVPPTPTQHNLYSQALSSQDDIPLGQHTNPNYNPDNNSLNDSFNLHLPDIELPYSMPNPYHVNNIHKSPSDQITAVPQNKNNIQPNNALNTTVQNILPQISQILPHIITILFASQLTDRIEAITKIGQLLKLDEIVNTTLINLNLSSRS